MILYIISKNLSLYSTTLICDLVFQYIFYNWAFMENHLNDN